MTQAPEIPSSVTLMALTFKDCTSLTQAPEIPSSVINMNSTFYGCTSLTGTLKINASNLSNSYFYVDCLKGVATEVGANLIVSGSCPQLNAIIATKSANSNITKGN